MLKILFKLFTGLLIILLVFIAYIVISTGYFRQIDNSFEGAILKKIALPGVEDISLSLVDSFAILSSTERRAIPANTNEKGGLYMVDLKNKNFDLIPLTTNFQGPFAPHGISMFKKDKGYMIIAINHTLKGHSLEIFSLTNNTLSHQKTIRHPSLISPNDIVLLNERQFYFTNDHKNIKGLVRFLEDYAGLALSNVIYFDGNNFKEVASNIAYANGINYDKQRKLLFVASPRKFLIKVYQRNADGELDFIENVDCKTGVDNIEFDNQGNLWSGAHPNLLKFASYAKGKSKTSPSEIIKINYKSKGNYTVESIFLDQGENMSASSVAVPFGDIILTGNVMDSHFLILKTTK